MRVHQHLPKPHDPFTDLVPPAGRQADAQALRLPEDFQKAATIAVLSASSRRCRRSGQPPGTGKCCASSDNLVKSGVRELLVVSQDTSAYGVDVKYRTGFPRWQAGQDAHDRAGAGARQWMSGCGCITSTRIRMSMSDPIDGRRQVPLPRYPVPARQPESAESDETPGQRRQRWRGSNNGAKSAGI